MTHDEADKILSIALNISIEIDQIAEISRNLKNQEASQLITECVLRVLGDITRDIVFPIEKMYPDLNPDL